MRLIHNHYIHCTCTYNGKRANLSAIFPRRLSDKEVTNSKKRRESKRVKELSERTTHSVFGSPLVWLAFSSACVVGVTCGSSPRRAPCWSRLYRSVPRDLFPALLLPAVLPQRVNGCYEWGSHFLFNESVVNQSMLSSTFYKVWQKYKDYINMIHTKSLWCTLTFVDTDHNQYFLNWTRHRAFPSNYVQKELTMAEQPRP